MCFSLSFIYFLIVLATMLIIVLASVRLLQLFLMYYGSYYVVFLQIIKLTFRFINNDERSSAEARWLSGRCLSCSFTTQRRLDLVGESRWSPNASSDYNNQGWLISHEQPVLRYIPKLGGGWLCVRF